MRSVRSVLIGLLLLCAAAAPARAQDADTTRTATRSRLPDNHNPETALRRALTFPGLGQIYNRQIWKTPIVYAGIGAVTSLAFYYGRQHRLYTRAFQYKGWQEQVDRGDIDTHPFPQYADEYRQVVDTIGQGRDIASSNIRPLRDKFRRNRDLSLFGIGLVYGLAALDAYISAHLLDFDVDEDLTATIYPHPDGRGATLRLRW